MWCDVKLIVQLARKNNYMCSQAAMLTKHSPISQGPSLVCKTEEYVLACHQKERKTTEKQEKGNNKKLFDTCKIFEPVNLDCQTSAD